MKQKIKILQLLFFSALILSIESCQSDEEIIKSDPEDELTVNNNFSDINQRVTIMSDTIGLISDDASGRKKADFKLVLVSEVASPKNNGQRLMATSIDLKGNLVAVSYNVVGDTYAGGVDLMVLKKDQLRLNSQIITTNADVNAAYFDDSKLYLVGSASGRDSTAFIYRLNIKSNTAQTNGAVSKRLGGFSSTSIVQEGKSVYVTTGNESSNGGGLYVLEEKELEFEHYIPLQDARWVQASDNDIFVQEGITGNLSTVNAKVNVFESSFSFQSKLAIESKSTFDVSSDLIFIASGAAGVQIHSLKDGSKVGEIPLPDGASSEMSTNSVSVEDDLIFISNGTAVYVAEFDEEKTENPNPEIVGKLDLGDFESVNHVGYRNGFLLVAAGLGGTKVIEVITD